MSYINLLFPLEQLEALGNKWPEPSSKRRKLDLNAGLARGQQQPRRQDGGSSLDQRRHTVSTPAQRSVKPSQSSKSVHSTVKRSYSDCRPTIPSTTVAASTKLATTSKSCLPSFIEPSLLKNYLHHLHPNDRSRYSIPNSPEPEEQASRVEQSRRHDREDSACSPASLTTDTSSSVDTTDHCPTPSTGIYDQLRARPFGHLIDGLRLTEHERDLMEDLLSPNQIHVPSLDSGRAFDTNNTKRKAKPIETDLDAEDIYDIDESLLQRMFPAEDQTMSDFGYFNIGYKDSDVHSSGLSPAAQEEEHEPEPEPTQVLSTRGFAITVDDFFDLDEASELTGLTTD